MKSKSKCFFIFRPFAKRLDLIYKRVRQYLKEIKTMTTELQALKTQVEATVALQQQTIAVLNTLLARLANQDAPQDILDLKASLEASTQALQAALASVPNS